MAHKKSHRWGVKLWVLSEADTGYTWRVHVYKGRAGARALPGQGVGYRAVTNLVQPILNRGHHVTTDSFFTSPQLAHYLWTQRTYLTGTINPARKGLPRRLQRIHPQQNELVMRNQEQVLVVKTRHNREVTWLSTYAGARLLSNIKIRNILTVSYCPF